MIKSSKNIAILLSGGKGTRFNSDIPKQYIKVDNVPIICYTISTFEKSLVDEIIIVVAKDYINYFKDNILSKYNFKKVVKIVEGGKERVFSVKKGLDTLVLNENTKDDIILVHDGARPFISSFDINQGIKECISKNAVVIGTKAKDTIKITDENDFIKSTPNRNNVWLAQTPQIFKLELIKKAYEKYEEYENLSNLDNLNNYKILPTDDSSLIEFLKIKVKMIQASSSNIKITTKDDLDFAKLILTKNKIN